MKVLKIALAVLGIAGVITTIVLMGKFWLDSKTLLGAAQRYDAGSNYLDPMVSASIIVGVAAASFFVLGLAVGLPMRTAARIRRELRDEQSQQAAPLLHGTPGQSDSTA